MLSFVRFGPLSLLLTALVISSCGPPPEERPELQPGQGMLIINGEPAEGAMVVLHPADGKDFDPRGTRPKGKVGADGLFNLTTYQEGDGVPVGKYNVAILWLGNPDSNNSWDKLSGRFARPETTGITMTIQEGANTLEPIELSGVRIQSRPPRPSAPDPDGLE